MTWLLKLYPPRWRRRYGAELADLVAAQPFSIGAALDLVAGAIDAWSHPELVAPASSDERGDVTMIAKTMGWRCAGYGPAVTPRDKAMSVAVMLGGTLLLTLLWFWAQWQIGPSPYATALLPTAWILPYLVGLRYTSLKGRSMRTQALLMVGLGAALTVFFLLVAWIGERI